MSVTVVGVPETITRTEYRNMIESFGFNSGLLTSLVFNSDGVVATVEVEDENGKLLVDGDGNSGLEIVTNTVYIRVVEDA